MSYRSQNEMNVTAHDSFITIKNKLRSAHECR